MLIDALTAIANAYDAACSWIGRVTRSAAITLFVPTRAKRYELRRRNRIRWHTR